MEQLDPGLKSAAVDSGDTSQPDQRGTHSTPSDEIKYLIVDDIRVNLTLLSKLMGRLGLQCQKAENGQEAIDAYKKSPDQCRLIFMDISMPVVDGLSASRAIRSYEKESGLSPAIIIGLTASSQAANVEKMILDAGMNNFLQKPIRVHHLKSIVESYPV